MSKPQATPPRNPLPSFVAGRRDWLGYLGIVAVTLLVYFPTFRAGFVWNDPDYVTRPELRSLHGLWQIWSWPFTTTGAIGATEQYYPLLHSAFWVQHKLWGDSASAYHLFNVLLHAACACLLVVALRRLLATGGERWEAGGGRAESGDPLARSGGSIPWLAGVLFAVHPVYVESVAWISEQKNTQSLLFYLLAAIAYLRFAETEAAVPAVPPHPGSAAGGAAAPATKAAGQFYPGSEGTGAAAPVGRDRWARRLVSPSYLLATFFFVCALLSKSLTASLPAALLVVLWWRRGRLDWRRDWLPLLPWLALGAAAGGLTGWVEREFIGAKGEDFTLGFIERGVLAGRVIWFYIAKFYWPADLVFIYPRWEIDAGSVAQWLFPVAAVGLLAGLWLLRRRARGPLAAYLFFTGSLFPTMGFFNVYAFQFSYVADHWNYLPSLGLLVAAASGVALLAGRRGPGARTALLAGAGAVVAVLGGIGWRQCGLYRDIETLFRITSERNPAAWMAHQNLGVVWMSEGRVEDAIARFERTIALKPTNAQGWNNLGVAFMQLGRGLDSLAHLEKAVAIKPDYAEARFNLGLTLRALERDAEAAVQFRETLRIQPAAAEAHYQLGKIEETAGREDEAAACFRRALEIRPTYVDALAGLGRVHLAQRRYGDAVEVLERAAVAGPDAEVQHLLGLALTASGRANDAIRAYQRALQLEADRPGTLFNLGLVMAMDGRVADAVAPFREAVRLRPDYADASQALAQALAQTGRPEEAAAVLERAQAAARAGKAGP